MYLLDEKLGRRRFLKLAGAIAPSQPRAVALPAAARSARRNTLSQPTPPAAQAWGREAGEWIPSCCNMCGGQSGILVHVVNGVVEKIEPNHWNPNNYSNISTDFFDGYTEEYGCKEGGAICPKGNAGIVQLYDPDRVKKPLKRTNPDKSPGADPQVAGDLRGSRRSTRSPRKLQALRDAGEAHKLLWMSEDHSFTHIQDDFCKLFGTPNYSNHSNLCDVARKASFKTVVGDDRPLADFIQSKYILLFGWNPTSAIKWVYLPRILTRAIEKAPGSSSSIPYLSDTAAKAHEWVAFAPAPTARWRWRWRT